VTIGLVLRPYGLRGEVKVRPLTDRPRERFTAHMSCTLWEPVGDRREPCRIAACRFERDTVYLRMDGVDSPEAARRFCGRLLAVGRVPAPLTLDQILTRSNRPWLFVAADGLSNAENLGAIVRNCAAFGVHALIVGETSSSPFLRRAVRSSMGAIFQLPVIESTRLADSLSELRRHHLRCIAAHPHAIERALWQADFRRDCCVIFGSEGAGLSADILAACDEAVTIPMPPTVDSLNVSSAAAAFLYEVARQRSHQA
jgi:tRNA G18 (ribose-2'-O)-methylase SpoU